MPLPARPDRARRTPSGCRRSGRRPTGTTGSPRGSRRTSRRSPRPGASPRATLPRVRAGSPRPARRHPDGARRARRSGPCHRRSARTRGDGVPRRRPTVRPRTACRSRGSPPRRRSRRERYPSRSTLRSVGCQTRGVAKVTIIGAGSVEFTRGILADLCAYEELHGSLEIALHDIDAERLVYATRAADQIVERSNAGYDVSAHESRASAFDGADYLINEIQVGGYPATRTDFDVPKTFGLRQTIGATIGIGGIMRGLRTIPVMIEMADEMLDRCPDGLLLNYTNPMAMVPWGIWSGSRLSASNVVGVCHSVRDTHAFPAARVR